MPINTRGNKIPIGTLLALSATFLWGSNAVIGRYLAGLDTSMVWVAFARTAIGGVLLFAITFAAHSDTRLHLLDRLRNRWVIIAMLSYGANMVVFHIALKSVPASLVVALQNTAPVVALIGGRFLLNERLNSRTKYVLLVAGAGICFIGLQIWIQADTNVVRLSGVGLLLAVLSGITWGAYTVSCRGSAGHGKRFVTGAVDTAIVLLGGAAMQIPIVMADWSPPQSSTAWLWILVLGVVHSALATIIWRVSLNYLTSFSASIFFQSTIVFTILLSAVFLGEFPSLYTTVGAFLIIAASIAVDRMVNADGDKYGSTKQSEK